MGGLLSVWAAAYGLPDPMLRADEINTCDAAGPSDAADTFHRIVEICRSAGENSRWAQAHLAYAWTAPQPAVALALVAQVAEAISAECALFAEAAQVIGQVIIDAQRDVATTLAEAEATIAAEGLQYWFVDPIEMARVIRGRCAVVMRTDAALDAVGRRLDSALFTAGRCLADDPRRHLPPGMTPPDRTASGQDRAHRAELVRDLASGNDADRATAAAVDTTLARIGRAGLNAQLLEYSAHALGRQGAAAIAIGDIATADTVAVLVPGIGNAPTAMDDAADLAIDLQRATETAASQSSHATVIWFGYDIPLSWPQEPSAFNPAQLLVHAWSDTASATNAVQATVAGRQLDAFARQLRHSMDEGATLTLIGHSYGSTVVSQAAHSLGPESGVDDIVLLASPGAGPAVPSAAEYGAVAAGHVYTLAFPADPVAQPVTDLAAGVVSPLSSFGTDPNDAAFGAQRIAVPSNTPVTPGLNLVQHGLDNYLSGPALGAVAGVVTGHYARVPTRRKEK